jgi:divalent metal cation (Fe/Co/Zn/Cd) transporter
MDSHDMVDNIERAVYKYMGVLLTVHMDPMDLKDPLTVKARAQLKEIANNIDYIIGVHDVRVISGTTHHNIIFDVMIDNDCKLTDSQVISQLRERIVAYNPMYRTVITVDKSYE